LLVLVCIGCCIGSKIIITNRIRVCIGVLHEIPLEPSPALPAFQSSHRRVAHFACRARRVEVRRRRAEVRRRRVAHFPEGVQGSRFELQSSISQLLSASSVTPITLCYG
jgi:hypothetical protein